MRELTTEMNRFDVVKWLDVNGPTGGPAVTANSEGGPSGIIRIELAGDDDEAIMKAKREANDLEKRLVCSSSFSPLASEAQPCDSLANEQGTKPTSFLDCSINHLGRSKYGPTRIRIVSQSAHFLFDNARYKAHPRLGSLGPRAPLPSSYVRVSRSPCSRGSRPRFVLRQSRRHRQPFSSFNFVPSHPSPHQSSQRRTPPLPDQFSNAT